MSEWLSEVEAMTALWVSANTLRTLSGAIERRKASPNGRNGPPPAQYLAADIERVKRIRREAGLSIAAAGKVAAAMKAGRL